MAFEEFALFRVESHRTEYGGTDTHRYLRLNRLHPLNDHLAEYGGSHVEQQVREVVHLSVALQHVRQIRVVHVLNRLSRVAGNVVVVQKGDVLIAERIDRQLGQTLQIDLDRIDTRPVGQYPTGLLVSAHPLVQLSQRILTDHRFRRDRNKICKRMALIS